MANMIDMRKLSEMTKKQKQDFVWGFNDFVKTGNQINRYSAKMLGSDLARRVVLMRQLNSVYDAHSTLQEITVEDIPTIAQSFENETSRFLKKRLA